MFTWNEDEVTAVLGVAPAASATFGRNYEYILREGDVRCTFSFTIETGDVSIALYTAQRSSPLFTATLLSSPGLYAVTGRASFVEIAAAGCSMDELPFARGLRLRPAPLRIELIEA